MAAESHRKAHAALAARPGGRRARTDHGLHLDPLFMTSLLDRIDRPQDLHGLSDDELQQVAQEVRELLIDTVGEIGGHFGANLGACEIAVAVHSLLDSPRDKVLWDVGHQAYPHKVLTGRRDEIATIRKYGGLAPFCSRAESEHDIMGAGHASTAIGYAVGIKEAMLREGVADGKVVSVVGDGAMTGGVAFEAVSQAGGLGTPIVVILNDNGMSISPNVGALSRYLNRVRLDPGLWEAREGVEEKLTKLPAGHRRGVRAPRPAAEGVREGVLGARPVVGGARLGLPGRHRRPRRPRAAPRAALGVRGRAPRRHPLRHGQGQGLRARRGGRPRGHGEVACRQAEVDRAAAPGARLQAVGARAAAVHAGVRRGAGARVRARSARDRHHRGDELRHRPFDPAEGACPTATSTSGSPSSRRCCSPPARRCRGCARWRRSIRRSCSARSTRSSTTSACRTCRSPSAWTAPGWSATTARHTTASSTSRTCGRCRT